MTPSTRPPLADCRVSIVLPLFNEAEVLRHLHNLVAQTLEHLGCDYEILFVNDGSTDASTAILDDLAATDARVKVLHFSRNFGHQAAVHAGLSHARGDCVIVMDSDLQDDPASIAAFLAKWQEGFDVVYAVRIARKENALKRMLFYSFYRLLNSVSRTRMPPDAGNFGLVDGRVAREIAQLVEHDRYYPGLRSWVGYRQTGIPVERGERHDDRPRVSLFGLFRLAKSAIFSFSTLPLSIFYFIAAASLMVCFVLIAYAVYSKWISNEAVPMWASIITTASFFGALNALGIGILGEYVVRIYDQVRARPLYVVARKVNVDEADTVIVDEDARATALRLPCPPPKTD
jgi:dolichol-phosphate mannosyltransferase